MFLHLAIGIFLITKALMIDYAFNMCLLVT